MRGRNDKEMREARIWFRSNILISPKQTFFVAAERSGLRLVEKGLVQVDRNASQIE